MEYMGNNPADVGKKNVWGIANPHLVDFFNPNFDIEGGMTDMGGGSGGSRGFTSQGVSRGEYEAAMANRYANTVINAAGDKGYTGQGNAGARAGINAITNNQFGVPNATPTLNPYVNGSRVNGPLAGVGSSNPRKNYGVTGIYQNVGGPRGGYIRQTSNRRVTGGR